MPIAWEELPGDHGELPVWNGTVMGLQLLIEATGGYCTSRKPPRRARDMAACGCPIHSYLATQVGMDRFVALERQRRLYWEGEWSGYPDRRAEGGQHRDDEGVP